MIQVTFQGEYVALALENTLASGDWVIDEHVTLTKVNESQTRKKFNLGTL